MDLNENQLSFLNTVQQFSRFQRYHGMMPKRLAQACNEQDVRQVFSAGYVALGSIKPQFGQEVEGLYLTDKGLKFLQSH